jgi:SAM-dependent methyltransferase
MGHKSQEYVFGANSDVEHARLRGIEELWDSGSVALLTELGLGAGWRCLEIGAGGGSMVEWMARQQALVTAVDIDTRLVEHLVSDTVTVQRLDVRTAEFPQGEFDLVHARLVFQHLSDRQQILERLAAALCPGGWMVIEDYDWTCFGWDPQDPVLDRTTEAILRYAKQTSGAEVDYGRQVVDDLNRAGLIDVRGEGRARIIDGGCPGFDFFKLSVESLRQRLIDAGALSAADSEMAAARLNDPGIRAYTPMMMVGIGRRG